MMNIDQARAGDGGLQPLKKKNSGADKNTTPDPIFESDEAKLKIAVPEGWKTERSKQDFL